MVEFESSKTCLECGSKISGRTDKKFCGDHCRTSFNNRLNGEQTNYIRNVNNILRRNRRILARLNTKGKIKVGMRMLKENGFEFGYFTHVDNNYKEGTCHFCYEQGYLALEDDQYLLVAREP